MDILQVRPYSMTQIRIEISCIIISDHGTFKVVIVTTRVDEGGVIKSKVDENSNSWN